MGRLTKEQHVGLSNKNSFGTEMIVIDYIDKKHVLIEFQDEYTHRKYTDMSSFKKGSVSNPYDKTVLNAGFLGYGHYSKKSDNECYLCWHNMLVRCFSKKFKEKFPTYQDVTIQDEWLNFQNFAKWYYDNIYYIDGERIELDKDILSKGNKVYCSDKCIFVPRRINSLIISNNAVRGDLPIGVSYHDGKFRARCNTLDKCVFLGHFDSIDDAFDCYKRYKEKYINDVANEYRNKIPEKLYYALCQYTVERSD